MKKEMVVISLEKEKLRAIKKYMDKKEVDLQEELVEQLEKLYEKYVPSNVQEYINDGLEEEQKIVKMKKHIEVDSNKDR